ncbi:hypothetical protein [Nocardioides sp. LML1-1-1.1]|uniref:hypothetical protein n=1 Tax=Nocardioides sp. LML1-1-1.1 TaxID=3135248 RepID=UPI00341225C1
MNHPTTSATPASSTLSTTQRAELVAHALHALADHIDRYHLPEPGSIELEEHHLQFAIRGDDAAVWQASLLDGVDEVRKVAAPDSVLESCIVTGRLPDTGVRVVIEWVQLKDSAVDYLQAVTR